MQRLDDQKYIRKFDKKNLTHEIIHMPQNILWGYEDCKIRYSDKFEINREYDRVLIIAEKDDQFAAEIVQEAFHRSINLEICYPDNPHYFSENDLIVFMDYAGVDPFMDELFYDVSDNMNDLAIISNQFHELDSKANMLQVDLKERDSELTLPYKFTALLKTLEIYKVIPSQAGVIKEVIASLISRAGALAAHVNSSGNFGKISAAHLSGKLPFFIAENRNLEKLANSWQNLMIKRAQVTAFSGTSSELIKDGKLNIAIKDFDNIIPIFIKRFGEQKHYQKYSIALCETLSNQQKNFLEFYAEGNSLISEYFSLIYLGEMISCYLAILNEQDPADK